MNKILVGIEIEDSWNTGDFREFTMSLTKDDRFEVHIISNSTTAHIITVGAILRLPDSQIHIVNFTQDKIAKIEELGIDIYLENLKYVADQIENTTQAYGVYINDLINRFYSKPEYIVQFERLVNELNEENCGELKAKEE